MLKMKTSYKKWSKKELIEEISRLKKEIKSMESNFNDLKMEYKEKGEK